MRTILLASALALANSPALAADWTYRGHLTDQGKPANGNYDLEITVYDSERGGLPVSAPIVLPGIIVSDGAFAAHLSVDQGNARGTRWLSVAVKASGEAWFEPLPSREKALLSPDSVCTGTWDIAGNAGNPVGSYLGTSDNVTLQLRANNTVLGTLQGGAGTTSTAFGANAVASGNFSAVGGGTANAATGNQSTIAGGDTNQAKDVYAAIGGGFQNQAGSFAMVGGGDTNIASADSSVVGGGSVNLASAPSATVSGGSGNKAEGQYSVVGGGQSNDAKAVHSAIGGGQANIVGVTALHGTIAGGQGNTVNDAFGGVLSGFDNQAGSLAAVGSGDTNNASGDSSFIGSGTLNVASGAGSAVPGGSSNLAGGSNSFAGGNRAKVTAGDNGTFIWADSTAADFSSTGSDEFRVRAGGGVVLNSSVAPNGAADLVVGARAGGDVDSDIVLLTRNGKSGDFYFKDSDSTFHLLAVTAPIGANFLVTSTGAVLTVGGVWTNNSSRALKDSFRTLDPALVLDRVLAMRVDEWSYKAEGSVRHVGPVAEDFREAFGLGADAEHISTVDASGVALAAIQGLAQKVEKENAALRAENAELRADVKRVAALEQQLAHLTARLDAVAASAPRGSDGPDTAGAR